MESNTTHRKAYEAGRSTSSLSYNDIVYGELVPSWVFEDFAMNELFEMGRQGHDFPEIVSGWRYGDIPESGRSYNYATQEAEAGVSMMQLDGQEKIKTLAELRGSFDSRPKVRVTGFLNPLDVGGDGEPLIICARISK